MTSERAPEPTDDTVPAESVFPRGLAVALLVTLLAACSSPTDTVPSFVVAPLNGPPGTPLVISGFEVQEDQAELLEAWVGDVRAPLLVTDEGEVLTAVPVTIGPDGWPEAPAGPQAVELRVADNVVGRSAVGVTVEELVPAPGSARMVERALVEIADGYGGLLELMPMTEPTLEGGLRNTVASMLSALVHEGENSLAAVLNGTAPILGETPADTAVLDALLASSGAVAFYQDYAAALGAADAALAPLALGDLCDGDGDDVVMACLMQIQVVLRDFAEVAVKPTAHLYAHTVGLAAGAAGLVGATGPAAATANVINSLLGVADFVMNKVVPALLPSRLVVFDIELASTRLDVGDLTESTITASATNSSIAISAADLAELVASAIGLKGMKGLEAFDKYLLDVASLTLDIAYKEMRAIEDAHPGTFPDLEADHLHVPSWTWGPHEVTDDRLITLFSYEPEVAVPLPEGEVPEWMAVAEGEATLRVQPRGPGTKAKLLRDHKLCVGCVYSGGAFGLDSKTSTVDVVVGPPTLTATPASGKAPLDTTFNWARVTTSDTPVACTLDPGDGSMPYAIDDCANAEGLHHTYASTSRLRSSGGAYTAVLTVAGSEDSASTDVTVGWTLAATPKSGDAPLAVEFTWSGFDPSGPMLTCRLDPGDGSDALEIADCADGSGARHTYETEGSYSATLHVEGGAFADFQSVDVVVAPGDPSNYYTGWFTGLFEPSTGRVWWEGTARFERDPDDPNRFRTTTATTVRVQRDTLHVDCTVTYDIVIEVPPHEGVEPIAQLSVIGDRLTTGQITHWRVREIPATNTCPDGTREIYTSFQHAYLYIPFAADRHADADGVFTGSGTYENVTYSWSIGPGLEPPPGRPDQW